jgi:class 3 adenylate cyclase/tetratricopeptide (TPR) repeat protein
MSCELIDSALSGKIELEDLRDISDAYHRRVAEVSDRFGGLVCRRIGKLVLVNFGYPEAHEDDAERAVSAALELSTAGSLPSQRANWHLRVGIATGQVIVNDSAGRSESPEQALIGEAVDLSGRLLAVARSSSVAIDQMTRTLIGDLFTCRDRGLVEVVGGAAVHGWEVLQRRTVESRFAALRSGTLTPLVGRDEEIELLQRRWSRAKNGEERVVLISGEPGIGKSRIVVAFEELIQHEAYNRLSFSCSPQHADSTFHPFIEQLERSARFRHDDTPARKFAKLQIQLSGTTNHQDLALLAELLSLPATDCPPLNLSVQRKKERTSEVLVELVAHSANQQPALIIVEDAHWIDATSQDVLTLMLERLASLPVLVLVTFRPEFQPPWVGQPNVTIVSLSRLSRRESALLARHVRGGEALPERILDEIAERTDGVPLFVEEVTKAVLETGGAFAASDASSSMALLGGSSAPATLQASLMARLDRLGPGKQVAQIGAAIGREFSQRLLALVAPQGEDELQSSVDRLVESGLIFRRGTSRDSTFLFKHALIQDTAYGTLLRGPRQELHAHIAEALEAQFSELVEQQPEVLAYHLARANQAEKAVRYWTVAGDLASKRSTGREAAAHYRAALRLIDAQPKGATLRQAEPELCMKLGNVMMQSEGYGSIAAIESYRQAQARATDLGQPVNFAKAGTALGPLLFGQCRYKEFLGTAEDICRIEQLPAQTRVHLLVMMGVANYCLGNFVTCWEHCDTARAIDSQAPGTHENPIGGGDPAIVMRGYQRRAAAVLGKITEGLALTQEGLAIARARKDTFTLAWALFNRALALRQVGAFAEGVDCANEAAEICEQHGFRARLGTVLIARGALHFDRGDTKRGIEEMFRGRDIWRATSGNFHMSEWLSDLIDRLLRADRRDEAEAVLREAECIASDTEEKSHLAELWRLRGITLFRDGVIDKAAGYLRRAIDWANEHEAKVFELRARRDLARFYFEKRSREMAVEILKPALDAFPGEPIFTDLRESQALITAIA